MKQFVITLAICISLPYQAKSEEIAPVQELSSIPYDTYYQSELKKRNIGKSLPELVYNGFLKYSWESINALDIGPLPITPEDCMIAGIKCTKNNLISVTENSKGVARKYSNKTDTVNQTIRKFNELSHALKSEYGMPSNYPENKIPENFLGLLSESNIYVSQEWVGVRTSVILNMSKDGLLVTHHPSVKP